ncbi:MAG: WbqC family protein [Gallionella sp.]|nr:WbqC family protein [Gallionella sp.]
MKTIAIMQPYFFPYIGYWQLIYAADYFVLFDDAQYMRHGWVNRNRILKPGGGWQYILVPLKKHAVTESIKNVHAHPDKKWKELIIGQLAHYKKKARHFDETNELVREILFSNNEQSIAAINFAIIKKLCAYLDIKKEIVVSSEQNFDYADVSDAGEWALRIAEQMEATEYINPAAGAALFNREKFSSSNIKLTFLKPQEIVYSQRCVFEPSLSIIDVLMFNGVEGTKDLLKNYSIESSDK